MASKPSFSAFQWAAMGPIWSVRSLQVKFWNMVWVESTAVGTMEHSTPMAEIMGRATVKEHLPRQEISWMLTMRFINGTSFACFASL